MAEVHHFAHGWMDPGLSMVMAFLGFLLGLVIVGRARETEGPGRLRWLGLAAVALGGTGIWLLHFMAMFGFDVPGTPMRYRVGLTLASLVLAIGVTGAGLFAVSFGNPPLWRIVAAGGFTGVGVTIMHFMGISAVNVPGLLWFNPVLVALTAVLGVVASTVALWFAVAIRGASATVGAAAIMTVAVAMMHYTGMASVRLELAEVHNPVEGVSPFVLLPAISLIACVVMSALAYATVGYSVQRENARQEAVLARTRNHFESAAVGRLRIGTARHR